MYHLRIYTGKDLKLKCLDFLKEHFGKAGAYYYTVVRGIHNSPVKPQRVPKSLGIERTFTSNLSSEIFLEEKIKEADLIITGEGKLDQQSLQGKVVGHMAHLCQLYHKPLIVIAGASDLDPYDARQKGIDQVFTILSRAKGIEDAMDNRKPDLW